MVSGLCRRISRFDGNVIGFMTDRRSTDSQHLLQGRRNLGSNGDNCPSRFWRNVSTTKHNMFIKTPYIIVCGCPSPQIFRPSDGPSLLTIGFWIVFHQDYFHCANRLFFKLSIERRENQKGWQESLNFQNLYFHFQKNKTMQYYLKMSSCQSSTCFI